MTTLYVPSYSGPDGSGYGQAPDGKDDRPLAFVDKAAATAYAALRSAMEPRHVSWGVQEFNLVQRVETSGKAWADGMRAGAVEVERYRDACAEDASVATVAMLTQVAARLHKAAGEFPK